MLVELLQMISWTPQELHELLSLEHDGTPTREDVDVLSTAIDRAAQSEEGGEGDQAAT
jgi:hypothetical protein